VPAWSFTASVRSNRVGEVYALHMDVSPELLQALPAAFDVWSRGMKDERDPPPLAAGTIAVVAGYDEKAALKIVDEGQA
jgi:hypothetical protein